MGDVATINVVNEDVQIVQVGNGNTVHNIPSDLTLDIKVNIDSKDTVTNPSINVYLGTENVKGKQSEGIKVKVNDKSEVKNRSKNDSKFCGCRWSEKAFQLLTGMFTTKYTYGCSSNDRKDTVEIKDRQNVVLEGGDAVLSDGSFVIYLGDGYIAKHDKASGKIVKLKLDVRSEFEKWELWNNTEFCDYFTQSERVIRANRLLDSPFEGNDSDFIAWCFTGMDWTEASTNGYKLYCR